MNQPSNQEYYSARAVASRDLAQRAAHPSIAAIHADFAVRYEQLAAQPERQNDSMLRILQAT